MNATITDGFLAGLSGALSILATDAVVTRVSGINQSRVSMGVSRVALGMLGALGLDRVNAPKAISCGVASGPVMMTTIEMFLSTVSRPIQQQNIGRIGQGGVMNPQLTSAQPR